MRSRSSAAAAIVATGLAMTVGAHAADPPAPEFPRADCTKRIVDAADDTKISDTVPLATPGLDIVSLFLRTTPDDVWVFLKMKSIPAASAMPQTDPAYRYSVSFKHGTTLFTFKQAHVNPQYVSVLGASYGKTPETTPSNMPASGGVDPATGTVFIRVDRSAFPAKAAGLTVDDGQQFTDISAVAVRYAGAEATAMKMDDLKPTGDAAKFTIGDDYCFGPAPAALSDVTATAAQFGDVSTLSAKLVSEKGEALANEQVTFTVAGSSGAPITATTDATGVATAPYTVDAAAGTRVVTVAFAGTATAGKASAPGSLVVRAETTKFLALAVKKTSTTARAVTATLRDDDGKAVVGQKVGWYANGKLVATLVTDASGRTVYKGAKAGQAVQARFAGLSGKYLAAKSNTPKV